MAKSLRNEVADLIRKGSTLDDLIEGLLDKSKHLTLISEANESPAIRELITHFKKSAIDLQVRQNQLSESPEKHLEEIRALNALRKVTQSFVSFFDIPKQAKQEVHKELERLSEVKERAELQERQTSRF